MLFDHSDLDVVHTIHLYLFSQFVSTTCLLSSALPVILAHSGAIEIPAMIMSIFGGLLIYGTIISFSMFFQEQEEF